MGANIIFKESMLDCISIAISQQFHQELRTNHDKESFSIRAMM